jgi:hypothetical protein
MISLNKTSFYCVLPQAYSRHALVVMSMDTVSQLGFKRLSISTQRPAAGE